MYDTCTYDSHHVETGCLCGFSQNDGVIPISRNVWSVSFVCFTAGLAVCCLSFFYLLVDHWRVWSGMFIYINVVVVVVLYFLNYGVLWCGVFVAWAGKPLIYLGKNPILIFACSTLFSSYFPFRFTDSFSLYWFICSFL